MQAVLQVHLPNMRRLQRIRYIIRWQQIRRKASCVYQMQIRYPSDSAEHGERIQFFLQYGLKWAHNSKLSIEWLAYL